MAKRINRLSRTTFNRMIFSVLLGSNLLWLTGCGLKKGPDRFFTDQKVHRIDIVIDTTQWNKVMAELTTRFGKPGSRQGFGPRGGMPFRAHWVPEGKGEPDFMPSQGMFPPDGMPPQGPMGEMPEGMDGAMAPPMMDLGSTGSDDSLGYVPCKLVFENKEWADVGFRVKGNSSLMHTWMDGKQNVPFRLKFAEFQDSTKKHSPKLFFGMEKLSFSNGLKDDTRVREKLASDLFLQAGVPAARTALCEVYLVIGHESRYMGIYTAVEIVEDTLLGNVFGDGTGNCYKPEGRGASFAKGSFAESSFVKKNNKKSGFDDVAKLYQIVNDSDRLTNPTEWERRLESVFDVNGFLKWLAVNSVIQNWDTYGAMPHNYYLYNNPQTGQLTWIPWDNNEALSRAGMRGSSSLDHAKVGDQWPLIRYLLDRPAYAAIYKREVEQSLHVCLESKETLEAIERYRSLVLAVEAVKNDQATVDRTNRAFDELKQFVEDRKQAVLEYLNAK